MSPRCPETPLPFGHFASYAPTERFLATQPRISSLKQYQEMYDESINTPEAFWSREARELEWFHTWSHVNNPEKPREWFVGGKTNICYNALDRHVKTGKGDRVALKFENEKGHVADYTYSNLLSEVSKLANALEIKFNISRGDRVLIYLPLCPQNIIAMLACVRIGAIHTVVFGGFSSAQIRLRVEECTPKLIITADGSLRRMRPTELKNVVDLAIEGMEGVHALVLDNKSGANFTMKPGRDHYWCDIISDMSSTHSCAEMDSEDHSFILYTSGSTGTPKGVVHSTAGYMLGAYATVKYVFDLKESDTYWCTADMGWITGHTYVAYGPLLLGGTQLIYDGTYNCPSWGKLFDLVEKYSVSILYTSPTLLRSIMAQPAIEPRDFDLSSLRLLGSVGEPINITTWEWFFNDVGQRKCPIVDTWWQTETGCNALTPIPGATTLKPGMASVPFFGIKPIILDVLGSESPIGESGRLYIANSWPSMLRGMWSKSGAAFEDKYFCKSKKFYNTGDLAIKDSDGHYKILGRADDQLNVSGHRIGSAEVESAISTHPAVAKVAVVGTDDAITGQAIVVCVVLATGYEVDKSTGVNKTVHDIINQHVTSEIGPHARPKHCYVVDVLPETKSGKTMRGLIKELLNVVKLEVLDERQTALNAVEKKYSTLDKDALVSDDLIVRLAECLTSSIVQ